MIAPKRMAQNHDVALPRTIFLRRESTSKNRLHTQDGKESRRDGRTADGFGPFAASHIEVFKSIRGQLFERAVLAQPIQVIRRRDREEAHSREALGGRDVPDLHNAGGVLVREGA